MTTTLASHAVIAGNADVLAGILDEDIAIAIWQRPTPPSIASVPLCDIQNVRFQCSLGELADILRQAMDVAGFGKRLGRHVLLTDILMLANHFALVMQTDLLEIRLKRVTDNACRKFHDDYVTARLICTYIGQGTQWLDGVDASDCGCGDAHGIRQLGTGDVALMKGSRWSKTSPAIHRSPPIEGTGEERLVLVINQAGPD